MAGQQKTLCLAKYPDVSLEVAGKRHEFARRLLENGVDPTALKRALGRHVFGVVTREWIVQRDFALEQGYSK
jgi:hypothetical protein